MKLYSKNLRNLDELKKEKLQLQAGLHADTGNIFGNPPPSPQSGDAEKNSFDMSDAVSAGIDLLTSKGMLNKVLALGIPLLSLAEMKIERKIFKVIAKEFLGGYLKWKAIELGAKATISFMKRHHPDKTD